MKERLNELLFQNGMTESELVSLVNEKIKPNSIDAVDMSCPAYALAEICNILNCPLGYLIGIEDEDEEQNYAERRVRRMMNNKLGFSEDNAADVMEYIDNGYKFYIVKSKHSEMLVNALDAFNSDCVIHDSFLMENGGTYGFDGCEAILLYCPIDFEHSIASHS